MEHVLFASSSSQAYILLICFVIAGRLALCVVFGILFFNRSNPIYYSLKEGTKNPDSSPAYISGRGTTGTAQQRYINYGIQQRILRVSSIHKSIKDVIGWIFSSI